ncbi:kinase-like protein [Ramaria rubella]|nr:kinase-like protein [Ramaria rubella]
MKHKIQDLRPSGAALQSLMQIQFQKDASSVFRIDKSHTNPHTMSSGSSTFYVARRVQGHYVVMVNVLPLSEHDPIHELQARTHPNLITFIGYYEDHYPLKWLIMEYMRGDWLNNVVARNFLQEDHVARIAAEVCHGLDFLHDMGLILRTVKTDGIFLTREGEIKICDLQNVIKLDADLRKETSAVSLVAPHWMPPEIARDQAYTIQTDTWSLGIMVIEILDKVPPHFTEVPKEVLKRIAVDPSPALNSPSRGSSIQLHNFLENCLILEQKKRPSVKDLLSDEFLSSACPSSNLVPLLRHKFRPISLTNNGPKDLNGKVTRSSLYAAVHGGFSDVYLGSYTMCELPGGDKPGDDKVIIPVAIKVLRSVTPDPETHRKIQKRLNRELSVWNGLRHPNVVELFGICSDMSPYSAMVSAWYRKGSAPQFLRSLGDDATLYVRLRLLTDVAAGLEYLHRYSPTVVHGDMKGANILISEDDSACLCDFGLSTIVGEVASSSNFTSTFAGSLRWTSPELIQPSEGSGQTPHVTTWSDIYALGSVTYELLTGLVPYYTCKNDVQVMFEVIKGIKPARPSTFESAIEISDKHWDFMECCWRKDPLDRPPISVATPRLEAMYSEAQPPWHLSVTKRKSTHE